MKLSAITFDFDGLDVLAEGYGIKSDFNNDIIYTKAVPRITEILNDLGIKATFFTIAKEINSDLKRNTIIELVKSGCEIGNHSLEHKHLLDMDRDETYRDTSESTKILSDITGKKISGYRGPSLTFNNYLMDILIESGYKYDSSLNPTVFFICEWFYNYFFNRTKRNNPDIFFIKHSFAPSNPYFISPPSFFKKCRNGELLEMPISHVPYFNVPFYATFHFLFPWTYKVFKKMYYKNKYAVYHAHVLDFLDCEMDGIHSSFKVHPSLKHTWDYKKKYFTHLFKELKSNYDKTLKLEDMSDYIISKNEK